MFVGISLTAVLALATWFDAFRRKAETIDSIPVLPFINASADPIAIT